MRDSDDSEVAGDTPQTALKIVPGAACGSLAVRLLARSELTSRDDQDVG